MDMWQGNAKRLLGLLHQMSFGRLLRLVKSFLESCWISLTSEEIRVENTNALQTTHVEMTHQQCPLMCSVRTTTSLHLTSLHYIFTSLLHLYIFIHCLFSLGLVTFVVRCFQSDTCLFSVTAVSLFIFYFILTCG